MSLRGVLINRHATAGLRLMQVEERIKTITPLASSMRRGSEEARTELALLNERQTILRRRVDRLHEMLSSLGAFGRDARPV